MFVDRVEVSVQAGNGGNGIVSFRHEKFIDRGGPDGGDGGHGGNIILQASRNQNTLAAFRYKKLLKAESGTTGGKRKKRGRSGEDMVVQVPVGTVVSNQEGEVLADLVEDGQQVTVAKGGKGGFGNAHFTSSTRQAPRVAEKGEKGERFDAVMELKMIADVGLVGLPNAGKSTLLATISNAEPEIADYPFTTLKPNLGVVDISNESSVLFADIPGLIEGASQGKGLGDDFLRHVERTAVLIHLIDTYNDNVSEAYLTIQTELKSYKIDLTSRPQIVVLNKIDGLDEEIVADKIAELRPQVPKNTPIMAISAKSKLGVSELLFATEKLVTKARKQAARKVKPLIPVLRLSESPNWKVTQENEYFLVTGKKIERFAAKTDFLNEHGVQRLRDIMQKMGITNELLRKGIAPGNRIRIGDYGSIEY